MIINDLDGYYIVFDTKNWNTELDTLTINSKRKRLRLPMFPKLRHDAASDASRRSNRRVTTQ